MRISRVFHIVIQMLIICTLLAGCAVPQPAEKPQVQEPAPINAQEDPTTFPKLPIAEATVTPQPTQSDSQTSDTTAIPTMQITHLVTPGNPAYSVSLPGECNTGFNVHNANYAVRQPCDSWNVNLLERPVSQDLTQYYHYIDLLSSMAGTDKTWYYTGLDLFGAGIPDDSAPYTYFFEIDTNQDGRGDFLLSVQNLDLYNVDWSVAGVQVWQDVNGDVGGQTPVRDDPQGGDGYETLIFDQGQGNDPDLAWARRSPDNYARIEFAFKPSLLGDNNSFMWWAGAMRGNFSPQAFDLVDSASGDSLYQVDTTCGWIFGRERGYTFKKCYVAKSTEAPKESNACIQPPHPNPQDNGWVWNDALCKWELIN